MNSELFLGVDPGASGYIVGLGSDRTVQFVEPLCPAEDVPKMAEVVYQAAGWIPRAKVYCVLEHCSGHWKLAKSTVVFAFGRSVGQLEMALYASGVAYTRATPREWQEYFDLPKRGGKPAAQAAARKLLPGYDWSQANADAGLLALYCYGINFP